MNILAATKAYLCIKELMGVKTDYKTAHALLMAKKALQPHAEFYASKEHELMEAYAERDGGENPIVNERGEYSFTRDKWAEYSAEKAELDALDVDIELVRKTINPLDMSAAQLENIMEIFDFTEV